MTGKTTGEAQGTAMDGTSPAGSFHHSYRQAGRQCPDFPLDGVGCPSAASVGEAERAPASERGEPADMPGQPGTQRGESWGLPAFADDPEWCFEREFQRCQVGLDSAGSEPSNTDPVKRQSVGQEEGKQQEKGGIDTLEVTVYGGLADSWEGIEGVLRQAKEKARERRDIKGLGRVVFGGMEMEVLPGGAGRGSNSFEYVLLAQGMTFKLSGSETGPGENRRAVAGFEIPSEVFMCWGELQAVRMAYAYLRSLGVVPTDDLVSRVDLCADLPGESMAEVKKLIQAGGIVTRAKKKRDIASGKGFTKLETVYFGAKDSPVQLRIYDKVGEPTSLPGTHKRALLEQYRWGGDVDDAVRVEFQLRREHLREQHGIHTVRDLFNSLETLSSYLCEEWFRFVDGSVDEHRHYDRCTVSRFWRNVQEAFKDWTRGRRKERRPGARAVVKPDRMWAQSMGCGIKAFALEKYHNGSREQIFDRMYQELGAMMANPTAYAEWVSEKVLDTMEDYLERTNGWRHLADGAAEAIRTLRVHKPGFLANR